MKRKTASIMVFILSLIALFISIKLFWNMSVFVDEFNTSPDVVLGGEFWLYMNWLRLGCLSIICILSGVNLLKSSNK